MAVKTPLWSHQRDMADFAMSRFADDGFAYWFADCGTGKTLAALETMWRLHTQKGATKVLVLTVKAAIQQVWIEDIQEHTENFRALALVKKTSKDKAEELKKFLKHAPKDQVSVVVVNYETAKLLPLEKYNWDIAIADESHRLSQHNSQISLKLAKKLAHVPYKLAMTGTAWADRLSQIYGQFRWGLPLIYNNSHKHTGCKLFGHWDEFLDEFTRYYQRDNIKIIPSKNGYKNVVELSSRIAPYVYRVHREEVIDLPPIHHIRRKFSLPPVQKQLYKEMLNDKTTRIKKLDGSEDVILAEFMITLAHRLHQITRGWYVDWDTNETSRIPSPYTTGSVQAVLDLIEEIGGQPTVIFTSYKEDVRILKEALSDHDVLELTGHRHEHEQFQDGDANILIANLDAGSTGVRLYRAKYIIYYGLSPSTSRTNYLQSIERVHRPKQTNPVTVFHLIAEDTVDEKAYQLLEGKKSQDEFVQELVHGT